MADAGMLGEFLAGAVVDPAVFALRPDYRALLVAVDGIGPSDSDPTGSGSEELLGAAEAAARQLLAGAAVEDLPHVAAWREAYRGFGAKPQRTRNSLEALTPSGRRRPAAGEPADRRLQRHLGAAPGPARR